VKEIKKTLMINEEEARSDDEEDNRKKVNRILAYQLYHNNLERE